MLRDRRARGIRDLEQAVGLGPALEPAARAEAQGAAEVRASHRVSEVNEELGLEIPEEEDFETLGGFVLAELGHFPKQGESFLHGEAEFTVLEASDRRVLRVGVRRLAAEKSA